MAEQSKIEDATQSVFILGPGAEISHYTIEKNLGNGGMGEVYLAHDNSLNRRVALKFLAPNLASDSIFKERFIREARLAGILNHPNIVTIYEVSEIDDRVYIAMEYVEGSSLRELIDSSALTLNSSFDIAIQICEGLAAAHKSKQVHRDIKPANIIVDTSNRVRILDFGLAKAEGDAELTNAGTTIGTINYMSPEQSQGKNPDCRGDIFSVGIVIYELLTSKLPFKAANIPATLYSIVNDNPKPLSEHVSDFPEALQGIIDKALAKNPDDRYQKISDLAADLRLLRNPQSQKVQAQEIRPQTAPKTISLAVLYLRNIGREDDEFLSYGITEDLIIDLTRLGKFRVASMRSIMKYKDSEADIDEIAAGLNVDMILEGSIHKSEQSIRVSAQLVDVKSGDNLWADRWEESPDNLPHIKKALAEGISQAFNIGKTVVRKVQEGSPEVKNAGAYENYLKAKYNFNHKKERMDVDIALGLYSLALKEEPGLLAAKAGIAEIMMYNGDFSSARIELESALMEAANRGLRADQADILRLMSELFAKQSNWEEAEKYGLESLNLSRDLGDNEGEASSIGILISIYQPQARFDEAIVLFDRVLEIGRQLDDQEKIAEAIKNMGIAYSRKGDYDRALSLYEECLEKAEQQENLSLKASCLANIGNVYYFQGQLNQAYEHYEKSLDISDKIGDRALSARQNLNMGLIQIQTGKHKDGIDKLESSANSFHTLGDKGNYALAMVNISQARLTIGEFEESVDAANTALELGREIGHPLVQSDSLMQLGSAYFFNRDIDKATNYFQQALDIALKSNISRNIAHINLALVNLCFYSRDFDNCKKYAKKALSIAREIGEKTALIMANAYLGAVSACEGLFNSGLRQLEDSYRSIEKTGNTQMTIQLKTLLGEILMNHGKTEKDKNDGNALLEEALSLSRENVLALEIKLITGLLEK